MRKITSGSLSVITEILRKSGRCCFVMHSITASIMAILYCILMLLSIAGLAGTKVSNKQDRIKSFEVVNSGVLQDGIKSVLDDIDLASVAGKVSMNRPEFFFL